MCKKSKSPPFLYYKKLIIVKEVIIGKEVIIEKEVISCDVSPVAMFCKYTVYRYVCKLKFIRVSRRL